MSGYEGRHVVATAKYGKGYDAPWIVFHGTREEVRADVDWWFGPESVNDSGLTASESLVNASQLALGVGNAASLGAVVIPKVAATPKAEQTEGNPWAGLGDEPSESPAEAVVGAHPYQGVLDAFGLAQDTTALQLVWSKNQDAFTNEDVINAYKARGKELSK